MKTIKKQSLKQRFTESMIAYPERYRVQEANNGVYWTDEAVSSLMNWVVCEFDNTDSQEREGQTKAEWAMACAQAMYDHLELADGDFDEPNETRKSLVEEIKASLIEIDILESMRILVKEGEALTTTEYTRMGGNGPLKEFAEVNGYDVDVVEQVYLENEEELNKLWTEYNS